MTALVHDCGHHLFLDLSNIYRTAGKIMVDHSGKLYAADSALLHKANVDSVPPLSLICPSCDKTLHYPEDIGEIFGVCYECGRRQNISQIFTICGYFLCGTCAEKGKYEGKTRKVDFSSIRVPLV